MSLGGWEKKARLIFIALIFLFPLAFAADWALSENDLYLWILVAVGISSAFLGLAYMAAKMFEIQVLEAWVKIELKELAISIFIAVLCIALIASVNSASQFLSEDEDAAADVIDNARNFLRDELYHDGRKLYMNLAQAYFNTARTASYTYTAGLSVGFVSASYSNSPGAGLSPIVMSIGQAMDSTSNFMLLASTQSAFLLFFRSASFLILPIGIFLRSFSLTRKIGGLLLAGVIAAAVVYPAAILLSKEIYGNYRADLQASIEGVTKVVPAVNPPIADAVCSPYMRNFIKSPLPLIGGELGWYVTICIPLCAIFGCHGACYKVIELGFLAMKSLFPLAMFTYLMARGPYPGGWDLEKSVGDFFNPVEQYVLPATAKFTVLSLVSFLIPIIITLVILRSLATSFGAEPQLYGLSKLV